MSKKKGRRKKREPTLDNLAELSAVLNRVKEDMFLESAEDALLKAMVSASISLQNLVQVLEVTPDFRLREVEFTDWHETMFAPMAGDLIDICLRLEADGVA